jgi:hypothetical protein
MFIHAGLSNNFEIIIGDTVQPIACAGFSRCECGHFRVVNDFIFFNDAYGPTGNTWRDTAIIVYPVGKEFRFATGNPVISIAALDADISFKPSFFRESIDELPQHIDRCRVYRI